MRGREQQIFRDCYNLLTAYSDTQMTDDNWETFKRESFSIQSQYKDIDDKMLALELLQVISQHLNRTNIEK